MAQPILTLNVNVLCCSETNTFVPDSLWLQWLRWTRKHCWASRCVGTHLPTQICSMLANFED